MLKIPYLYEVMLQQRKQSELSNDSSEKSLKEFMGKFESTQARLFLKMLMIM